MLAARTNSKQLRRLIRERLRPALLEWERGRIRRQRFLAGAGEPSLQSLEGMLDHLLDLDKKITELRLTDLLDLQGLLLPEEAVTLRQGLIQPLSSHHEPLPPAAIRSALSRFFEWCQSPAFGEMHAVEQMTLSQIRLHEISPFEAFPEVTISLFSYYFLLADGYLLPCYKLDEAAEFHAALNAGLAFSTADFIRLNLRACKRAYDLILGGEKQ